MVEKKKGDTEQRMNALSLMLKEIYIPLMEQRTEIKHHMTRFNTQITTSIQQAYGQITIDVPYYDENMSEERIHSVSPDLLTQKLTLVLGRGSTLKIAGSCGKFLKFKYFWAVCYQNLPLN